MSDNAWDETTNAWSNMSPETLVGSLLGALSIPGRNSLLEWGITQHAVSLVAAGESEVPFFFNPEPGLCGLAWHSIQVIDQMRANLILEATADPSTGNSPASSYHLCFDPA